MVKYLGRLRQIVADYRVACAPAARASGHCDFVRPSVLDIG
jgi:hypothetical protein